MEGQPTGEQQAPAQEAVKPLPFTERVTDIFASPGELFENVRITAKTTSNWFVPWIIMVVIGIVLSQLMLNNPSLEGQLTATIKKGFDKSVQSAIESGRMTQEQADEQFDKFARPGSTMFTILQVGGTVIGTFVGLFLAGLFYWLLGKTVMRSAAPYMKVVEIVGLTFFIFIVEQIVTTAMMFAMDNIHATPSLGLLVSDFDFQNKSHLILAKINIFTFWELAVISIGLSKLFQRDFPKVAVLVFALWILWSAFSIFTGIRLS